MALASAAGATPAGAALSHAATALRELDDAARRAVSAVAALDGRRVAAEESMTVDTALLLHSRMAPGDVATLLTVSDVLAAMPVTASLFSSGVLSWGHVRQLAARVRRFDRSRRERVDDDLGEATDQFGRLDADRVAWAIDDLLDHHERRATVERREARDEATLDRFVLQPRLDGTSTSWGEWSRESTALLADALTAEADAPPAAPCPGDADAPDGGVPSRAHQLGHALLRLVTRGRHGSDAPTPPTRFAVTVDLDAITDTVAGRLRTALRQRPPTISRLALDRLACDAAIDAVIIDGANLLAAQRYAPEVTAATRRAVTARDGGCRWPGCTAPVAWCDVHHVVSRAESAAVGHPNGDHHPANLLLLCRRHHTTVHRRGWRQELASDGAYTVRRRGRSWSTLPRTAWQHPSRPAAGARPHLTSPIRDGPPARDGPPVESVGGSPVRDGPPRAGPVAGSPARPRRLVPARPLGPSPAGAADGDAGLDAHVADGDPSLPF